MNQQPALDIDPFGTDLGNAELHIEKDRIDVAVRMVGGERLEGDFFLFPPELEGAPMWRRLIAFLGEREWFVPLATREGDTLLIARHQIVEVVIYEPEDGAPALELEPTVTADARIEMIDERTIEGTILIENDHEHARLSDFVASPAPFLYVRSNGDRLVNKRHVRLIRPNE